MILVILSINGSIIHMLGESIQDDEYTRVTSKNI